MWDNELFIAITDSYFTYAFGSILFDRYLQDAFRIRLQRPNLVNLQAWRLYQAQTIDVPFALLQDSRPSP
jgi:hypothetical protein